MRPCCAISPTNLCLSAPSVAVMDVRCCCSTTNVALNIINVHGAPRIVGTGSTLHVADCNWTARSMRSTGSVASTSAVARCHSCGALSPLLGCDHDVTGSTDHIADNFAEFFNKKVRDVRSATTRIPPPPTSRTASSLLVSFRPCTQTEMHRIVMQSSVKSCMLDPVPTFLVREFIDPVAAVSWRRWSTRRWCRATYQRLRSTQQWYRVSRDRVTLPTFGQCRIWPLCRRSLNERQPVSSTRIYLRTVCCLVISRRIDRSIQPKQRCFAFGLQWMPVTDAASSVRRAARVGGRPAAVCALYS